jgi:sarcosine oxidase
MNNSIHYPVIVIGVGSMGSATCWHLASRGHKVLGLEQFGIPHDHGSHAGQSRIIRKAYFEHPDYVPLLARAYENWRAFEKETGRQFFYRTGVLYMGRRDNVDIQGVRKSAELYNIPIENLTTAERKSTYPLFDIPADFEAIYEPDAGFVTPERTVAAYVSAAREKGAVIRSNTAVQSWRKEGRRMAVATSDAEYTCDKLIVTAGAWASRMIPDLTSQLHVTRQLLAWVKPPEQKPFALHRFPCWFVEDPVLGTFYGFPVLPSAEFTGPIALKLAHHFPGVPCAADEIDGPVPDAEEDKLKTFLRTYIPAAGDNIISVKKCLYTSSPDSHFIIDHLPGYDKRVTVACGFSGHGFKFVPVVGEILADLAMKGKTDLPVEFLGLARLAHPPMRGLNAG